MNNQLNLTELDKIESEDKKGIDIVRPSETEPFAWGPHDISSPLAYSGNFGDLPIG
jgi:hypothetical protein